MTCWTRFASWILAIGGGLALCAPLDAQTAPKAKSPDGVPNGGVYRDIRGRSNKILQVQAQERVLLKQGTGLPDSDYFFRVETKPPSADRLYTLGSEKDLLESFEKDFRASDPSHVFLSPSSVDDFNDPDSPNLGSMWFQNRRTGPKAPDALHGGEMRIANGRGVFPVDAKPEVAILNQSIEEPDLDVQVEIQLGSPQSLFGIVTRASDPNPTIDEIDQIQNNSYYSVLVGTDTVRLGGRFDGADLPTIKEARIAPKSRFILMVRAFKDEIIVFRDGDEILRARDDRIQGTYAGVHGAVAVGQPTTFDNFVATRYPGPYSPRSYAQSASIFRGPNVHYNPLYFEHVALERYGQHMGNLFEPFIADTIFFADVALLPYSIAKSKPWICQSGEGYRKPGEPVLPFRLFLPPCDKKAILTQTAFAALSFSLIP